MFSQAPIFLKAGCIPNKSVGTSGILIKHFSILDCVTNSILIIILWENIWGNKVHVKWNSGINNKLCHWISQHTVLLNRLVYITNCLTSG